MVFSQIYCQFFTCHAPPLHFVLGAPPPATLPPVGFGVCVPLLPITGSSLLVLPATPRQYMVLAGSCAFVWFGLDRFGFCRPTCLPIAFSFLCWFVCMPWFLTHPQQTCSYCFVLLYYLPTSFSPMMEAGPEAFWSGFFLPTILKAACIFFPRTVGFLPLPHCPYPPLPTTTDLLPSYYYLHNLLWFSKQIPPANSLCHSPNSACFLPPSLLCLPCLLIHTHSFLHDC